MKYAWYDFAGNVGVALMVLAYLLLQVSKLRSNDWSYSAMNAIGAALVLVSLFFVFNLSAFLVEGFWLLISLFGLVKYLSQPRAAD
jgi:predicted membrane protein